MIHVILTIVILCRKDEVFASSSKFGSSKTRYFCSAHKDAFLISLLWQILHHFLPSLLWLIASLHMISSHEVGFSLFPPSAYIWLEKTLIFLCVSHELKSVQSRLTQKFIGQ